MANSIPYLQIRDQCVVAFSLPEFHPPPPPRVGGGSLYSGKMTAGSMKRIRVAVDVLLQRSPEQVVYNPIIQKMQKFRLTFVTITISCRQIVDYVVASVEWAKLLRWFRSIGVVDYVWKAELQARGQVHWHLTLNKFVRYDEIKNRWNRIQRAAGWLDDFHAEFGHWSPNSTDIHSVYKVKRIDLYLAKYLAKDGGILTGKVWGCSDSIRGKKLFKFVDDCDSANVIESAARARKSAVKRLDTCTVVDLPNAAKLLIGDTAIDYANEILL
jgi:hypothetical protein